MKFLFAFPLIVLMLSPFWLERVYGPDSPRADGYVGVAEGGIGVPPGQRGVMEGGIGVPPWR